MLLWGTKHLHCHLGRALVGGTVVTRCSCISGVRGELGNTGKQHGKNIRCTFNFPKVTLCFLPEVNLIALPLQDCPFIVCMTYAFHTPDKLCFILDLMNGKQDLLR